MQSESSLPPYGHSGPGSPVPGSRPPGGSGSNGSGEVAEFPPGHPIHLLRRLLKLPPFTGLRELAGLRRVPGEEPVHRPLLTAMWGSSPWRTVVVWILGASLASMALMALTWPFLSKYFEFLNGPTFLYAQGWRNVLYLVPPEFLFSVPFVLAIVVAWKARRGIGRLDMGAGEASTEAPGSIAGVEAVRASVRRSLGFQIVVCGVIAAFLAGVFPTIYMVFFSSLRDQLGSTGSVVGLVLTGSIAHTPWGWVGGLFHHQVLWRAEGILMNCIELVLFVGCLVGPFSLRRRIVLLVLAGYGVSIYSRLLYSGVYAGLDLNPVLAENLYGPLTGYLAALGRIAVDLLVLGWVWKVFSRKIG